MPKTRQETPDDTRWGRCRNCKRRFEKTRHDKKYCTTKCRDQYNNYGQTPQAQVEARVKAYLRGSEFRKLMREAVRGAVVDILNQSTSQATGMPGIDVGLHPKFVGAFGIVQKP